MQLCPVLPAQCQSWMNKGMSGLIAMSSQIGGDSGMETEACWWISEALIYSHLFANWDVNPGPDLTGCWLKWPEWLPQWRILTELNLHSVTAGQQRTWSNMVKEWTATPCYSQQCSKSWLNNLDIDLWSIWKKTSAGVGGGKENYQNIIAEKLLIFLL